MKVVIMAGGKGTRISSIKSDIPKPMIEVCGKPILEWQIENLKRYGLTDITLVIGHLGHVIKDYFKEGSKFGVNIQYFVEDIPLGTAGALFKMPYLNEDFILMCGDVILDLDFARFIAFHKQHGAWASLVTHPNNHPYDSSLIETKSEETEQSGQMPVDTHRVIKWSNKEDERLYYKNRVNAGIEIISPLLLEQVKDKFETTNSTMPDKIDLDREVLKPFIDSGNIYAYDTPEYIKDMGTPDRYYEVIDDIRTGKVKKKNLSSKQKAIFIDRDGTINKYIGFLTKPEQFELLEGVAEAIKLVNKSGYLAIVVTNQPVIARGDCTFEELTTIHNKMETLLGKAGAYIDGLYVCPHHTDKGFEGERIEYKYDCECRKPKPGLILQAAKDFNIDLSQSYIIGDSDNDVKAGINASLKECIKIDNTSGNNLLSAVKSIISKAN